MSYAPKPDLFPQPPSRKLVDVIALVVLDVLALAFLAWLILASAGCGESLPCDAPESDACTMCVLAIDCPACDAAWVVTDGIRKVCIEHDCQANAQSACGVASQ